MAIWRKGVVRETQATGKGPFLVPGINDSNRKKDAGVPPALTSAPAETYTFVHSASAIARHCAWCEAHWCYLCIRARTKGPQRELLWCNTSDSVL